MKNNLKRVFSLVLALMLCMTFIPTNTVSAKTFKDVPKSHWAYSFINEMSNQGYIDGYPNGTFKPQKSISFLEAMKFAAILTQYDQNGLEAARKVWLKDVVALGVPDWAQDNVVKCLAKQVINMKTLKAAKKLNLFSSNKQLSRRNLAEYFARAMSVKSNDPVISLPYKDTSNIPEESRALIAGLIDVGVLSPQGSGNGMFNGNKAVQRDQVAKMVYLALKYQATQGNGANTTQPVQPVQPVNPTPTVVTGTITEFSTTGATAILVVNDNTSTGKVFSLNAATLITVDGKLGNLTNLLVGQTVTVTAKQSIPVMQAISIDAKGVQFNLEGEVTNVDNDNKEIKISYTDSNKNKVSRVFKVDSDSSITINNRSKSLYDVRTGSQVRASIYNDKVKTLEVTVSSDDYKGYVKRVDYREITIVSLNGRENRYKLPRSERDFDVYDERDTRAYRRDRKSSLGELMNLVNSNTSVYVEIDTDSRNDDEVSCITIGDGFDNEYIVESNYERRRDRRDNELVLYPKGSYDSRRNRETYYYDSDLRADTFDSRRDVRVRDIGPGSRVVILDKDKDNNIKKIMVIDSRYNNGGTYYGNWVHGTLIDIGAYTITVLPDNSTSRVNIDINGANVRNLNVNKPYWFEIKDYKLQSDPTSITPNGYNGRYGYDRTITIDYFNYNATKNEIYIIDTDNRFYYIASNADVSGDYSSFSALIKADNSNIRRSRACLLYTSDAADDSPPV